MAGRTLVWAVLGTTGVGLLGSNTMPVLVGGLVDGLGLDTTAVGLLASLELLGVAVGGLLVVPFVARVSRRRMALLGSGLASWSGRGYT